ncbi:MAG: hypothetical protein EA377_01495 [Phycisphaerales bacterium]|nr:MAG: hypothetical protein EA377_01495 [Phycisphaerales bacterium]
MEVISTGRNGGFVSRVVGGVVGGVVMWRVAAGPNTAANVQASVSLNPDQYAPLRRPDNFLPDRLTDDSPQMTDRGP